MCNAGMRAAQELICVFLQIFHFRRLRREKTGDERQGRAFKGATKEDLAKGDNRIHGTHETYGSPTARGSSNISRPVSALREKQPGALFYMGGLVPGDWWSASRLSLNPEGVSSSGRMAFLARSRALRMLDLFTL